jgi:aconitate hydratase
MMSKLLDYFGARAVLPGDEISYYRLAKLQEDGIAQIERLPFSIRVLLEGLLRNCDGKVITEEDVVNLAKWRAQSESRGELPFKPGRVILQDFTGVPVVVDLASIRSAMAKYGGDPSRINPVVPVDLVIDHSVQVDAYGSAAALLINAEREFERNRERYEFLKWGQEAFDNFRVVPPATGIVHQVNLEYLGQVVMTGTGEGAGVAYPDTLVGTDSHTTMINGLGVVGWGVGGIEAEAAMLGQPIYMLTPDVVGFKLTGKLPEGTTATDLVLVVTQMLREKGVVGSFVEYFGPGLSSMSLPDRATLANMCPEYGATVGFFPVDGETLDFLRRTGRPSELVKLVEKYTKSQGLYRYDDSPDPHFSDVVTLDLSTVEPSLAGPNRPQDRIGLSRMKSAFKDALRKPVERRGFNLPESDLGRKEKVSLNGSTAEIGHGSVVIAAITSCTNTSNPSVMISAGLLARNAVEKGLQVQSFVKTSLAPGSRVVTSYLQEAGLLPYLEKLGFDVVGYGCTTCIGNSGPISEPVSNAIENGDLIVASVLSGNRNFEGRIHALVRASYLASPPLVVAYALAGKVDIDFDSDPLGTGADGKEIFLSDIWPSGQEISEVLGRSLTPAMFRQQYGNVYSGNETWNEIPGSESELYAWDPESTYIQEPPFFEELLPEPLPIKDFENARVLVKVGDSVTTDHISPAGAIASATPAGKYLIENGVALRDFNSYGSRRGNDRIVTRGAFANVRLRNQMAPGTEGGWTTYLPTGEVMSIYDASLKYHDSSAYGTGSSRDQAAKGTLWLGVRFVIAESYERIHRSNLVGMGVLPLQFMDGQSADSLGLDGTETFSTIGLNDELKPGQEVTIQAENTNGLVIRFQTVCRIDTPVEVEYYQNGGILQTVLREFLSG